MPAVSITSPTTGSTVPPSFTAGGNVSGIVGPIPNPPPLTVHITIDGTRHFATSVTMSDSGIWTATFSGVPAGVGRLKAVWTPTGESNSVDDIIVE